MSYNKIDETLDLRIQRTHKFLSDALMSLLTEKCFDDIRISDICDKAMVHRTTFYKHFEDKYDLLNFSIKQLARSFEEKNIKYASINNPSVYSINMFRLILQNIYENKKMYCVGLSKLKNDAILKLLQREIAERTKLKLEISQANGIVFNIPLPILSEFYSAGLISLASWWIENDMPISIDEMVEYGGTMIHNITI